MEAVAQFDSSGEIYSEGRTLRILYSTALLDRAGIARVSVPATTMDNVRDTLIREVRNASGDDWPVDLADRTASATVDLRSLTIVHCALTSGQYSALISALVQNDVPFFANALNTKYSFLVQRGTLFSFNAPYPHSLESVPPTWDRQDVGARLVSDGGELLLQNLKLAALKADADELTLRAPNAVYEAFGLTESNGFGYTRGETGSFQITFEP